MTDGPNDIMVIVILVGVVLFVVAAGLADLSDAFKRVISTLRRRRRERQVQRPVVVDPVLSGEDHQAPVHSDDEPDHF